MTNKKAGFLRGNHPTFGYIPRGALMIVKEFGLIIFMSGVGLNAGVDGNHRLDYQSATVLAYSVTKILLAVIICSLFGAYVSKRSRAMLFGAIKGARTCIPAEEIINYTALSNIPALGYTNT